MSARCQMESTSRVRRTDTLMFSAIDDEFLAIDGQRGQCFSLNETAKQVWDLLPAAPSAVVVRSLCAILCNQFSIDAQACERDVIELLDTLRAANLVEIADAEKP